MLPPVSYTHLDVYKRQLNNVGGKMSYDGGRSSLFAPAKMRVGVGLDLDVAPQHQVGLHLEANKLLAPTFNPSDRKAPDDYTKDVYKRPVQDN